MFLCMKNPNENILHFILSLNFFLKMFAAVFHFFFPCSYNFNIILSEEYTKINKIDKASSNCIFTL